MYALSIRPIPSRLGLCAAVLCATGLGFNQSHKARNLIDAEQTHPHFNIGRDLAQDSSAWAMAEPHMQIDSDIKQYCRLVRLDISEFNYKPQIVWGVELPCRLTYMIYVKQFHDPSKPTGREGIKLLMNEPKAFDYTLDRNVYLYFPNAYVKGDTLILAGHTLGRRGPEFRTTQEIRLELDKEFNQLPLITSSGVFRGGLLYLRTKR